MRRKILFCLALAAITLAVYWPVRNFGLIEFDDPEFVRDKGEITNGLTWPSFRWALTNPVAANWHPVTTLSHMLDCQVFGGNLGAYHLVNVGLHALNSVLLFVLLARMSGATWRSALVAAIFAWHPLRVESVVWIAERKDVLSALFFMLTLLAYFRYVELVRVQSPKSKVQSRETGDRQVESEGRPSDAKAMEGRNPKADPPTLKPWRAGIRRPAVWYALALFFFTLGLMSKPMLVTLPFLLVLLDYWPLGRSAECRVQNTESQGKGSNIQARQARWSRLLMEKAPFLALSAAACGITFYFQKGGMPSLTSISLHDRVANAIVSYLLYLGKMVWPTKLSIIYPHPASLNAMAEQWPNWHVGLIALLLLAISALCVRQIRRRPYLAAGWFWYLGTMVPVIGLIQVGEQAMADRYTYIPLIGPTIALVWLASEVLAGRSSEREETHPGAECGVRSAKSKLIPSLLAALLLAACCLLTRRQVQYWRDTVTLFSHAAAVTANNSTAEFFVGLGLEKLGEPGEAMVHYQASLAINPFEEQAHYNLAQLLRKSGNWQQAADHYIAALQTHPADSKSRLNLANVLPHLGRAREAILLYGDVLQADPDSIEAANNLAWLLATTEEAELRNGPRAVQLAQHACELTQYKMTTLVGTLAAAYAEAGRFPDAVTTVEKACALAAEAGDKALLKKNQELLELYRLGQPYREMTGSDY